MTANRNLLIAGCGDVGSALGLQMLQHGRKVWGLRRNTAALPTQIQAWQADLRNPESIVPPTHFDEIVFSLAPDERTEEAYRETYVLALRNLMQALARSNSQVSRLIFCSSTVVYGVEDGSWIDETTPAEPANFRGEILLEAEAEARRHLPQAISLRLAGIYGPGRTRLLNQVAQNKAEPKNHFSNRVHTQDCAGILAHLLQLDQPEAIYLGSDHEPAPMSEVIDWVASQLDMPRSTRQTEKLTPATGKRCSNARLLHSGYQFIYPNYRAGYAGIIAEFKKQRT